MNMTLRQLNYTITREQMGMMVERDEYRDLITIAGLFNSIIFAQNNGVNASPLTTFPLHLSVKRAEFSWLFSGVEGLCFLVRAVDGRTHSGERADHDCDLWGYF
jgi:hypothetical protein